MKVQRSYRLTDATQMRIERLAEILDCSNTEVIERAVRMLTSLNATDDQLDISVKQLKQIWLM